MTSPSWTFVRLRSFFDLGPVVEGPFLARAPLAAFQDLLGTESKTGLQRVMAPSFRHNLIRETGLVGYAISEPSEVRSDLRTPEWSHLCEFTLRFSELSERVRAKLVRVWIYLGFLFLTLERVPRPRSADDLTDSGSDLAFLRAFAAYMTHQGDWEGYDPSDLEFILRHSRSREIAYFSAAMALAVYHAKVTRRVDKVAEARQAMERHLRIVKPMLDSVTYDLRLSRFYRAASFLPFLREDPKTVRLEMDVAEELARKVATNAAANDLAARENLHPLLESRSREAAWLGDLELAISRMQELLRLDPLDSKAHLELGEYCYRFNRFEKAAEEFMHAGRLGPPGTPIGYYMAGQAFERLGRIEEACHSYLSSLRADPEGISPRKALSRLARRTQKKWVRKLAEVQFAGMIPELRQAADDIVCSSTLEGGKHGA